MSHRVAAALCWLALVPALVAAPCRFRVCRPAPVVFRPPVVVKPAVKAVVVKEVKVVDAVAVFALPLVVTNYAYPAIPAAPVSAAYAAPGAAVVPGGAAAVQGAAGAPTAQEWRLLAEAVRTLSTDMQLVKAKLGAGANRVAEATGAAAPARVADASATRGAAPVPPPAAGGAGLARCAACHEKGVAAAKGKGNVFFDGQALTTDHKQRNRMVRAILGGTMPLGADGKAAPLSDAEAQAAIDLLTR